MDIELETRGEMTRRHGAGIERSGGLAPIGGKRRATRASARWKTGTSTAPAFDGPLPEAYEETLLVLLPVDPYLVHLYWEVSSDAAGFVQFLVEEGALRPQALLRFHDVTALPPGGVRPEGSFDVEVDIRSRNWYVHLLDPERTYIVDLGFRGADGRFHRIVRSNRAETPRAWPCGEAGAQSIRVREIGGVARADPVAATPVAPGPDRLPEPVATRPREEPSARPHAREDRMEERTKRAEPTHPVRPIRPVRAIRKEPEVPQRPAGNAQPVDASRDLRSRLEAAYRSRRTLLPTGKGDPFRRPSERKQEESVRKDLTMRCERLFVSGLPSSPHADSENT